MKVARPCIVVRFAALPFTGEFTLRPTDSWLVLNVWTGVWAAAPVGAVRAITVRLCTAADGVAMRPPRELAAPNELCRVGAKDARLLTSAPRNEASVTWIDVRFTSCPPTKPFRDVAVTALTL